MRTSAAAADPESIFERDGDRLVPTILSQGPWAVDAQHGGPVCAALVSVIEAAPSLVPMQLARCTFDLYRAVPIAPLRTEARVVREGKRLQLVEAHLLDGDTSVARASALRVRHVDTAEVLDHPRHPRAAPPPRTGAGSRPHPSVAERIGFLRTFEVDRAPAASAPTSAADSPGGEGRVVSWYRLLVPIIAGEEPSALQRLALFADLASSVASYLDHGRYSAINPDLSLQLVRPPAEEWLCLESATEVGGSGLGHSHARVWDPLGFVGTVTTSLLVDPVRAPFA